MFAEEISDALEMIAEFGQAVTWKQIPDSMPVDATKPWIVPEPIPIERPVHIVFLPAKRVNQQLIRFLSGGDIQTGNEYGLMGAVDFEPDVKDVVLRGSQEYRIESISVLSPNGEIILYTVRFAV